MLLRALAVVPVSAALLAGALVALPAHGSDAPPAPAGLGSDSPVTLTVVLPYHRPALHAAVRAVSTPGSPSFRQFPSLAEAAARHGASQQSRARLEAWAADHGMTRVRFDATGLTARVTGPARAWTKVYGQDFVATPGVPAPNVTSYVILAPGGKTIAAPLPKALRGVAQAVLPVYNVVKDSASTRSGIPENEGSPTGPGMECITPAPSGQSMAPLTYAPRQLHKAYGTTALHRDGLQGKGARLAILGYGQSFNPGLLAKAADCFEFTAPRVKVTGGTGMPDSPIPGSGAGSAESNLDVQTVAAVLPGASRIDFVEVAAGGSLVAPFIDGITTALDKVNPDVITVSYGFCVPLVKSTGDWAYTPYVDDAFAMAALVGTSVLIAAGDSGSSGCLHNDQWPTANLKASWPAASPWVTAVGGTRIVLGKGNTRVDEVVWNDTTWNPQSVGAGSGGPTPFGRPWYQASVTTSDRRVIPDVSAHASGVPGWPVALTPVQFAAINGYDLPPGATWGMAPVGGTSAATPFTAANVALIASRHGRLGLLNPWLYSLAEGGDYRTAFYDVREGTNQVNAMPACCRAVKGYDAATGLGSPNFDAWLRLAR